MSNNLIYITYQTFPAETANSLQTVSNIKYFLNNGLNVRLIFPLRDSSSSDSLDIINDYYGMNLKFSINGTAHNYPFGKNNSLNRIKYLISHFLWAKKTVKKLVKAFDVNDYCFTRSDWVFYFLSKHKIPVTFECHQYTKLRKVLIYLSLKSQNSKIVFLNHLLLSDYLKKYKLDKNYSVNHNGVDLSLFKKTSKKAGQIIFVGRLKRFGKSRNLEFLLRSFDQLNKDYSLKIIGATEEELLELNKNIKELKSRKRIEILPRMNHENISKYLSESEIGILINSNKDTHSKKYTSPLKYFEYLAGDLKIVATDCEAHKALPFANNISFFSLNDEKSFIEAIKKSTKMSILSEKDKIDISLDKRVKNIISFIN